MANMARTTFLAFAAASLLALGVAHAQDDEAVTTDPPDRAARLSYLQGDVSMQPAGEEDWAPAILNRPLTTGDKLWTEQGARAEVQVGPAAVRLDGDTGFSFLNVDDDTIQMRMTAGVVNVRVRWLEQGDHIELDTPNVAVSLVRPGNYRVEVNDAGDTTVVKVSEGEAEADGPGQNDVVVHNQEVATFSGVDQLAAQYRTLGAPDEFDSWSLERDRRDDRVAGTQTSEYVSPDVTGYEDLHDNGSWSSEPEYGYVWTPSRVAVGWAPYQFGRWVWVSPWGWTWIDDQPWGYAPFHYGRWAYVRQRWCWVPGPRRVRAVYAPALVGWTGSPGMNVGWFPLGPREVYVPARHYSHRYFERVNVTNTVIVNRTYMTQVYNNRGRDLTYRNRMIPGAVTMVSRSAFTSSGRVGDHRVRVDDREMGRWRAAAVPPPITPARESRYGGASRGNVRPPPREVVDRPVVVNRRPPASSESFTRRVAERVEATRQPSTSQNPRLQGRDYSNRNERNPVDRPRRDVSSSPKTPPNVGYADSQRAQVGTEQRRPDRPTREMLERREQDRQQQQERDRQYRQADFQRRQLQQQQEQQRRQAEVQQRRDGQAEIERRQQDQQRDIQNRREVQQRERAQRQYDVERQNTARQPQAHDRAVERPRNDPPRMEQRPQRVQEDRSTRIQRAQESRQQKRQDDSRPQKN
jgi:hypothetical protein